MADIRILAPDGECMREVEVYSSEFVVDFGLDSGKKVRVVNYGSNVVVQVAGKRIRIPEEV